MRVCNHLRGMFGMRRFVFWTGVYDVVLAAGLLIPGAPAFFGMPVPHPIGWLYLPLFFVICFGAIVIIASRDLKHRASFVVWDGVGRVAALLAAIVGHMGIGAIAFGVVDLIIALLYFTLLPRFVGSSLWDLLCGRPSPD